ERRLELQLRPGIAADKCGTAGANRSELKPPTGDAVRAGLDHRLVFGRPSLAVADRSALDRYRAVYDEYHARRRRQAYFRRVALQHVFVKAESWKHDGPSQVPSD